MPIVGSAWSSQLYGTLSGMSMNGSRLHDFTDAVGNGSQSHVVGKSFDTIDTGLTIGSGSGTGIGITAIPPSLVASQIYSTAVAAFGQAGSRLNDICQAIASTLVSQMALATLTSTHTPVFLGSGIVTPGSIPVVGSGWGSAIQSASSFAGSRWPDFSHAIGVGCAAGFDTATGMVTITGAWSGAPPLPPGGTPGAGTGSGTLS